MVDCSKLREKAMARKIQRVWRRHIAVVKAEDNAKKAAKKAETEPVSAAMSKPSFIRPKSKKDKKRFDFPAMPKPTEDHAEEANKGTEAHAPEEVKPSADAKLKSILETKQAPSKEIQEIPSVSPKKPVPAPQEEVKLFSTKKVNEEHKPPAPAGSPGDPFAKFDNYDPLDKYRGGKPAAPFAIKPKPAPAATTESKEKKPRDALDELLSGKGPAARTDQPVAFAGIDLGALDENRAPLAKSNTKEEKKKIGGIPKGKASPQKNALADLEELEFA